MLRSPAAPTSCPAKFAQLSCCCILFRVSSSSRFDPTSSVRMAPNHCGLESSSLEVPMLWTIFVILLVLWLVGVVSSYTLGGFIHLLLVLAVVALIFQLLSGRRAAV